MNADIVERALPMADDGHVEHGQGRLDDSPSGESGGMAENGAGPAGEQRPRLTRQQWGNRMTDEIDAWIEAMQAPSREPVRDGAAAQPHLVKLISVDEPSLVGRHPRHRQIAGHVDRAVRHLRIRDLVTLPRPLARFRQPFLRFRPSAPGDVASVRFCTGAHTARLPE